MADDDLYYEALVELTTRCVGSTHVSGSGNLTGQTLSHVAVLEQQGPTLRSAWTLLFFIRAFHLSDTRSTSRRIRLGSGIPRVLVAKELGDAARQPFPDQHAGCRMRQGSLSLTPWWVHRLLHKGIDQNSFLTRDFQIHSIQKSVFTSERRSWRPDLAATGFL